MRKSILIIGLCFLALTACGGGSSAPGGTITPPTSPPVNYTATLKAVSPLGGNQIQAFLTGIHPQSGTATPVPIMVVQPTKSDGSIGSIGSNTVQVQVIVSPQPPSLVTPTFANANTHVILTTPAPGRTPPPGVYAVEYASADNTIGAQSSGAVVANIGMPVNQSPTIQSYSYPGFTVGCTVNSAPALKIVGTAFVSASDIASADIYATGPNCAGVFNSTGAQTIHFPGGGVMLSTYTPYVSVAATQWANTQTSSDIQTMMHQQPDGSFNALLVAKTRDGLHIFKVYPLQMQSVPVELSGPVQVAGASIDGF